MTACTEPQGHPVLHPLDRATRRTPLPDGAEPVSVSTPWLRDELPRAQHFGRGIHDPSADVWGAGGALPATSHQIGPFRE